MLRVMWRLRSWRLLREWLAHCSIWTYYALLLDQVREAVAPGLWAWTGALVFVAFLVTCVIGEHGSPMCLPCMLTLASYGTRYGLRPRDAVKLRRVSGALRFWHWLSANRLRPYCLLFAWVCLIVVLGWTVPVSWHSGWAGVPYTAFLYLPLAVVILTGKRHHIFHHFCPQCRAGGGGGNSDTIPEPDPEPVPSGTKELQPV